jgi:MFS family permease
VFALGFVMRPIGGWLFGWLADAKGRRVSLMLSVLPMCLGSLTIALEAAWATVSGYTSVNAVVKAELFPAAVRATGVAVSLFGDTAENFALWFKQADHESGFYWYATLVIFVSLLIYLKMPDTKRTSRFDAETAQPPT